MAMLVMANDSCPLVILDLETAGLRPERHPIIQVAAIAVDERLNDVDYYEAKLDFDPNKANRQSLRKTHYHPGIWANEAIAPEAAARELAEFLRRHTSHDRISSRGETYRVAQLVAHNAAFDGPFLSAWFERVNVFLPAHRQVLCTMQRAQWFFLENPQLPPPASFALASLCRYFDIPFHAADAHEALGDAAATLGLYRALNRASQAFSHSSPTNEPAGSIGSRFE